jgi:hypothetical protein
MLLSLALGCTTSPTAGTPTPSHQPAPVSDPPPTATADPNAAPPWPDIRARLAGFVQQASAVLTPAKATTPTADLATAWEQYRHGLQGKQVTAWSGWVVATRPEQPAGTRQVAIDLDEFAARPAFLQFAYRGVRRIGLVDLILTGVPAADAQALSGGQQVVVSGTIQTLDRLPPDSGDPDPANAGLALVLTAGTVRPVSTAPRPPATAVAPADIVMTLTQPVGGMMSARCYTYELFIRGTGDVQYQEEDWEAQKPKIPPQTYHIPPARVQQLLAAFEAAHYFDLRDDYADPAVSDSATTTTAITLGPWRKSIFHDHADPRAPQELSTLEQMLRDLAPQPPATPTP